MLKRKRHAVEQAATGHLSLQQLSAQHGNDFRLRQEVKKYLDIWTPYGKLLTHIGLDLTDGPTYRWLVVNPLALLYAKCQRSSKYARFLFGCLQSRGGGVAADIALYTDETRPGNQNRSDKARETQAIYFTFIQFPDWYRNRAHGWLIYGYLEVSIQDRVVGGLSAVVRQVLLHFFSPTSFNIGVGIRLPVGSSQESLVHLRARLACLIQDGKAHQLVHSYKGASGWKCCPDCKNILNTNPARIATSSYLHHYATATPDDFDERNNDSFGECVDMVEAAPRRGATVLHDVEKATGLRYNEQGLLWDKYLRQYYNAFQGTYHDAMHMLAANGGSGRIRSLVYCLLFKMRT